jgi:hypothetical protein
VVVVAPPDSMHVGDTVVIHARAINRSGDSIPGAVLALVSLDPDTMGVDTARFAVIGLIAGTGRAVVKVGALASNPFLIPIR